MEQTLELLLGDLRSGKKELNRLFFVGLFFALATHFYVVEPYFLFKQQEASLNISKVSIEQSVQKLSIHEKELQTTKASVNAGLGRIRKNINSFPNELRDSLPDIQEVLESRTSTSDLQQARQDYQNRQYMQQQMAPNIPVPSIAIPYNITQFSPAVRWFIDEWFKKLLSDLDRNVVKPLIGLAQREEIAGAEQLDELAKEAVQQVHKHISDIHPDFWHTYGDRGGKLDIAGQIKRNIEQSFNPLEAKVEQVLEQTKNLRIQQSERLKELKLVMTTTQKEITDLSERLKTIESPFGRIPLGLTDLIKIFPFILAALAITLTIRLNQSLNLRSIIKEMFTHDDLKLPESLQKYQLGGWLFPAVSRKQPVILLATWFVIVIALSCRAAWLIGWTTIIFETRITYNFINQSIYKYCFTAVLILMALSAFKSLKKLYLT